MFDLKINLCLKTVWSDSKPVLPECQIAFFLSEMCST